MLPNYILVPTGTYYLSVALLAITQSKTLRPFSVVVVIHKSVCTSKLLPAPIVFLGMKSTLQYMKTYFRADFCILSRNL